MGHATILKLMESLREVNMDLKNSQLARAHCEAALLASWEKLSDERLAHQLSRGELRDATLLVHQAIHEARRSGQAADQLASEVVVLRAALESRQGPQAVRTEAPPSPTPHDSAGPSARLTRFSGEQRRQTSATGMSRTAAYGEGDQDHESMERNPAKRARV